MIRNTFLAFLYSLVMRSFLVLIVGVKYRNREVLKKEKQFIIVANHNSHVDTMALLSALPSSRIRHVHPVAAADYFGSNPIRAFITKLLVNTILIPRSRPVDGEGPDPVQMMFDQLEKGESLILFPEGSRGEPGKLQKFKKGIALLLEKYPHIPFIPVYMSNMGKVLPKGDGVLVPFNSTVIFGEPQLANSCDLESIVAQVEHSVLSLRKDEHGLSKER